jgi:hypothetical protein
VGATGDCPTAAPAVRLLSVPVVKVSSLLDYV